MPEATSSATPRASTSFESIAASAMPSNEPLVAMSADAGSTSSAVREQPTERPFAIPTAAVAVTAVSPTVVTGKAWHVDSVAGNDGNAGTQAAPWKTLARATTQKLAAGDAVLLKCGGTWRESITLSNANVPAGGGTLGIYGACSPSTLPVISGADLIADVKWQVAASAFPGKPVYVASVSQPVNYLFWNGMPLVRARYPNFGGIGAEFNTVANSGSTSWFKINSSDTAVIGAMDLTGATAYMRSAPWTIEKSAVSSIKPDGTIALVSPTQNQLRAGSGYYVEGKLSLLDAPGEWFYDAASKLLYVWTPDGNVPSNGVLESVRRATGIFVFNTPSVKLDQVVVAEHTTAAINIAGAKSTVVSGVNVRHALQDGIMIDGGTASADSSYSRIVKSTVQYAASNAIIVKSPYAVVQDNIIDSTGTGAIVNNPQAGINALATSLNISDNRVTNSGSRAIELAAISDSVIQGNYVSQACTRLTDCGAIYTYGTPTSSKATMVTSNTVVDMAPNTNGAAGAATRLVVGIYLDEGSAGLYIDNNMVSNVDTGIKIHNGSNNVIQRNTVWLTNSVSLMVHSSSPGTDMVRNNIVQNNTLYAANYQVPNAAGNGLPTRKVVYPQQWMHYSDAALMLKGAGPNIVKNNVAGTLASPGKVQWLLGTTPLNVQQWGQLASNDTVKFTYPAVEMLVTPSGADLVQNVSFSLPGSTWKAWQATAAALQVNFGTCATGCVSFLPGSNYDSLTSNDFSMNSAAGTNLYLLHLRATGLAPMTTLFESITRKSDGAVIGLSTGYSLVSFEESSYMTLFHAKASDLSRLVLNGVAGGGFRISDIGVYPVSSYKLFSPTGETALLANEKATAVTVDCPATGLRTCTAKDLNGNPVTWPIALAARSSLVVVADDATWKPSAN